MLRVFFRSIFSSLEVLELLLAVVVEAEVGDEVFAHDVAEGVFQLHRLDEEVVLGIDAGGAVGILEVEAQPLLDAEAAQAGRRAARSMKRMRSRASGAARMESRQRKSTLICIG